MDANGVFNKAFRAPDRLRLVVVSTAENPPTARDENLVMAKVIDEIFDLGLRVVVV